MVPSLVNCAVKCAVKCAARVPRPCDELNECSSALLMKCIHREVETMRVITASRLDLGTDPVPYRRNRRAVNRAAQLVHHSSALDPCSAATRAIVWLAFSVGLIWVGVGVSALFSPGPMQPPTWSASVPGQLKLAGMPTVTSTIIDDRSAHIVLVDNGETDTYRVAITDPSAVRTFWRGSDLIVDTAGSVWRVDTEHDLLLRAPASYAWPQD